MSSSPFRITVDPSANNGLQAVSQVEVDKVMTVSVGKIGKVIGSLDPDDMIRVSRALALWLGIAS